MANITGYGPAIDSGGIPLPMLLIDNGDGTYSLGIASVAAAEASATLYAGTLTTSTTAAALAASQAAREVIVQNDPDSTADILVGSASAQTIQLKPGWSVTIPVANLATVFVKSVSGAPVANYLGRS
jgi:hypothetical protein